MLTHYSIIWYQYNHQDKAAAPTVWNYLPVAIHSTVSIHSFWRQCKTFFLQPRLPAILTPHPSQRRRFSGPRRHCKFYKFTYLLAFSVIGQDQNQAPAPENLLLSHMKRWKQIRQK